VPFSLWARRRLRRADAMPRPTVRDAVTGAASAMLLVAATHGAS